jgi:hypothetical protein
MSRINRKNLGATVLILSVFVILLASGLIVLAAPENPQPEEALFISAATEGSLDLGKDPTILRTRLVGVNLNMLAAAEIGDTIVLNLFEDTTVNAVLDRKEATYGDGYAWIGHLQGQALSQVTLVVGGGQIAGNVSLPGAFYRVRYAGNEVHTVQQINQSAFPFEMEPAQPEPIEGPSPTSLGAEADACADIDVMVVWTAAARTAAGGTTAMENLVNLAVAETNQSYVNSGLIQRISLAHMEEVSYTESGDISLDLDRVTTNGDGYMDNVHTLRDTHYADLVSLFIEDSVYCGVAWTMSSVSTAFESSAFSVVRQDCATGYYSLGHEMGHNMGARHDWYVDDTLASPYSYNKGYVNVPDVWRTVMAYNTECALKGVYCNRLPYWSNPAVLYEGDPMGVPIGTSTACVANDLNHPACDADNRQTLNNTCNTVANFRDESGDAGPVVFDAYTVDDDDLGQSVGNGDGYADCGETIELYVDLYNQGVDTATAVSATLSTSDPYVTFVFNTSSAYGDIAGGATAVNLDDFDFDIDAATPHGHVIAFDLNITASNGGPWSSSFDVPVYCASPDSYEPDNDAPSATPISSGISQTHNIYPVGDEDWVTFTLTEESEVVIETSGPSGDTRMWLYDETLTELEYNDDYGGTLWSYIDRVCGVDALSAGTYYVQVDEYNDNDPIAEYDLTYTLVGPCATPPDIEVTPSSFSIILPLDISSTEVMTISNLGDEALDFVISDTTTATLWLTESPVTGTVAPEASTNISVTFDSTDLSPGTYTADIIINSNDPDEPMVLVPVIMKVTPVTQLYIEPSYAEIPEGGTFTVTVVVSDVTDLYGAALQLTFDPSYVQVVDHDPSPAGVQITPGSCPPPDFVVENIVDNSTGLINYDVSAISPSPACSDTGTIASITFQGTALSPEFPLHFSDWLLADIDGLEIPTGATDGTLIVVPPPSTVQGNVYLQGRTDHSGAEICAWDGGIIVDCALTAADGYYELPVLPGTYDVSAAMDRYLDSERLGEVVSVGPYPLPDLTLLGGDSNDDCAVDILDLTFMGARYGLSSGDLGWDERADINADGTINIQDLVLAGGNFNASCPVNW